MLLPILSHLHMLTRNKGQCGPVVKAESTYADNPGSIPSAGRKYMVVGPHYKTG